ncbi:RNA-directed DNA polymerase, eukaryota [Tanacetum coccineum]
MGDRNRSFQNSNENQTQKISKSVFVSNFPEDATAQDLWKSCNTYGTVVDVFIPYKRSKAEVYKNSFASVLKDGHVSFVIPDPTLVLDESCIKEHDFKLPLMGKVKDVSAIPNLPVIIIKKGFQNVKLTYLSGRWVRIRQKSQENRQKRANTDTRTEECARAGSQKLDVIKDPHWSIPHGECHVGHEKTPRSGFLYSGYSQKKHRGHITDCHVGNPCVHKYDPTNLIRDPIIEGIQGVRLEGAWEALKGLEGSAAGYKRPSLTHTRSSSFPVLE